MRNMREFKLRLTRSCTVLRTRELEVLCAWMSLQIPTIRWIDKGSSLEEFSGVTEETVLVTGRNTIHTWLGTTTLWSQQMLRRASITSRKWEVALILKWKL